MRFAAVLLVAFACSGAFASEPGQPLDCSDWVIDLPGISCSTDIPLPCGGPSNTLAICGLGVPVQADNEGGLVYLKTIDLGAGECYLNGPVIHTNRYELTRLRNGVEELVAHVQERCGRVYADLLQLRGLTFDATRGRVRMGLRNFEGFNNGGGDDVGSQLIAFSGLSTIFEILQSYTPQPGLVFRVPYMPEGMPAADHFDTYWGPLAHPINFTQAHPLQCDYPAAPPHVGDCLTVADTVPTPAPGQGVYYVTAATYQGETRYGRKTTAGHLSGRDPAVLPACGP